MGIIVLMSLNSSTFGQGSDYYYDLEVDYFPRIQSLKYDTTSSIQLATAIDGEFIETLELITTRILGEDNL